MIVKKSLLNFTMIMEEELNNTWFDMQKTSTILSHKVKGKVVGRNELFKLLREKKILQQGNNLPFKVYVELGYFKVLKNEVKREGQYNIPSFKTVVSVQGIEFIKSKINNYV